MNQVMFNFIISLRPRN